MARWNFYVPTITQAMRGKEVLETAGMRAFVSRNTDMQAGEGCSYMITVQRDGAKAERLLAQKNIKITRMDNGR